MFFNLRQDLIEKQKTLYKLAGLDENHFNYNSSVQAIDEDETDLIQEDTNSNFDMFETIEEEDESNMFVEHEEDFHNDCESPKLEEDADGAEMIVKIEKIKNKVEEHDDPIEQDVESSSFDYFEEIVVPETNV